ncbi:DUF2478 domain-containing protein [Rhodovulum euryhalinum]|uniref:Uncharacterized protein DUF2478 n=1 Tax=Rhodovulum euryhalinum TaxID=35805 RepID=A0A4R2KG15_9RHOB|nr:DUF2478 domain-containing protein [Rhodovulum euryhalinum]TCO72034.1 uncharacterized protein DUF2478 [Rhodovulum euryhalinum]
MRLAALRDPSGGLVDQMMRDTADWLLAEGRVPVGAVRDAAPLAGAHPCEMRLRVLPDGPRIGLDQPLGPGARGCRLDADALERAAAETERRLARPADIFLLNKFGRQEAEGHGFRGTIALALERDLPVLVGVGTFSGAAFDAFAGGLAETLPADIRAVRAWCRAVLGLSHR